jgi:ribosomal protein S18 acetylase RimI-like enzyme
VSAEIAPLDLADPATAEALVAVQRAAYRVEAELLGTDDLPPLRERPADLRASGERFLGAWLDGRLVGAVSWKEDPRGTVDIHRLAVDPGAFRRGIGSALLQALDARLEPARTVVATGAANLPARRLYETRGFRPVAEQVASGGVRIVNMERP